MILQRSIGGSKAEADWSRLFTKYVVPLTVLKSENWRPLPQESMNQESMMFSRWFFVVGVGAVSSFHCLDTIIKTTGRPVEKLLQLCPLILFWDLAEPYNKKACWRKTESSLDINLDVLTS